MIDILNFAFQSFWHFIGFMLLFVIPFRFVISLTRVISDWHNTRKHGWNPNPPVKSQEDDID